MRIDRFAAQTSGALRSLRRCVDPHDRSGGYGGSTHLAGALFDKIAGVDVVHIPYKGSASTIQALVSGEVAISFGDFATYLALVEAGKLRAIAVASSRRFQAAPNLRPCDAAASTRQTDSRGAAIRIDAS